MTKKIIINADDFGRSPSVSDGILHAHQQGIVTSCTAMTNIPACEDALRKAASSCPRLGFGVHLNITHGRPLLPARQVPSLVDREGAFKPFQREDNLIAAIQSAELRAEWSAQVVKMLSIGVQPDHLDSHHHLAYFNLSLFTVFLEVASVFCLPIRFPPQEFHQALGGQDPRGMIAERSITAPVSCVTSFYGAGATLNNLLDIIRSLPAGTHELMCHPGLPDAQLRASSAYSIEREREVAILTDTAVQTALVENQVALIRFSDL